MQAWIDTAAGDLHNRGMAQMLVTQQQQMDELVERLAGEPMVGFDTEFHSERTYVPKLMLLQLAAGDDVWLVDPLAGVDLRPLIEAMCRPGLLLIGHALKNDLRILWLHFGLLPTLVFDTQIAAAFLGHGLQAGLGALLHQVLGVHQPKGEQMADWSQRPLPDRLQGYAAGDVAHLLRLHQVLTDELRARQRDGWVQEECRCLCQPSRYERDPESTWQRVAGNRKLDPREAGVLLALVAEREQIAQQEDLVPHFLLTDEVLQLLARHAPRNRKELEMDRRFQQRGVQRYLARWAQAIAVGLENPVKRVAARPPPPPEIETVAALMMLLVSDLATREGIAPSLLLKRDALIQALREQPQDTASFAELAGLHGWRAVLLADPLWRLSQGQLHITCQPGGSGGFSLVIA